jgi:hypothetical protein
MKRPLWWPRWCEEHRILHWAEWCPACHMDDLYDQCNKRAADLSIDLALEREKVANERWWNNYAAGPTFGVGAGSYWELNGRRLREILKAITDISVDVITRLDLPLETKHPTHPVIYRIAVLEVEVNRLRDLLRVRTVEKENQHET